MFKKHHIQMKLVKSSTLEDQKTINNYNHYALPSAKQVAVIVGSLYVVKTFADTSAKIALHTFTK